MGTVSSAASDQETADRFRHPHLAAVLLLMAMSAGWYESDLYRYSLAVLLSFALGFYFLRYERPARLHFLEIFCLGWCLYAALRTGIAYIADPLTAKGRSEGLYMFPLFFSTAGFAMFLTRDAARDLFLWYFVISLVFLVASMDVGLVFSGEVYSPLYQSNPIHGGASAALILIGATGWLVYCVVDPALSRPRRVLSVCVAVAVIVFAGLGIVGANSKGVWLSLVIVVLLESLIAITIFPGRRAKLAGAGALGVVALVALVFRDRIDHVASGTAMTLVHLASEVVVSANPLGTLQVFIDHTEAPYSAMIRLQLFYNALTVVRDHFWFGAGPRWDDLMGAARYHAEGYTTSHNSYLEIMVRYGFIGLVALGIIVVGCVVMACRAMRRGLISPIAFQTYLALMTFYLIASITNSNSHLAFGESFIILGCGFGFCCLFLIRKDQRGSQ